jgi:hypothetical protein
MKNNVTITYKDGTTETVKPKYMMIQGGFVEIELPEKIIRKENPLAVNNKFITFKEIREIVIK